MYQPKFIKISHDISVEVKPIYLEEESNPIVHKHVFTYFITIRNLGQKSVKLLQRHWQIKDAGGEDHEVDGEGVIGVQPLIEPDDNYTYSSFCVLKAYRGSMQGYYTMEHENGQTINIRIPKFYLNSHLLN